MLCLEPLIGIWSYFVLVHRISGQMSNFPCGIHFSFTEWNFLSVKEEGKTGETERVLDDQALKTVSEYNG